MQFLILGPLEVRGEQGAVALSGNKLRGLLAVLLLQANKPVSTDRLALALWGQDASNGVTKTVQVTVSRLRKALGDRILIATTPAGYCLQVQPDELDATRFERLVEDGSRALDGGRPEHAGAVLHEALSLWRGPALADLAFEPFAAAEITRLEEQRLAALETRIEADLATGQHAELVGELRRLIAVHPSRERLAAQLMLALYRCGRQTDALEAYQDTRSALVADVGVEPGPRLRELQKAILRQDAALEPNHRLPDLSSARETTTACPSVAHDDEPVALALPRSLHVPAGAAFVGRDAELARLREHWTHIGGGARSAVMISGEPGIGKTRLASEFARTLHREGQLALYGRCDEGLAVPYQPFVEALRPYVRAVGPDRLRAELGDLAAELGRLLPELVGLGEPMRADPESERFALFEAVAALIETATREQRALLVLDDLHWATQPTLLLLRHLIRSERPLGALLLGTYRETELDLAQPLVQLLADLQRDASTERLHIGGLDEPAITALLEAAVGHALDERASQLVHVLAAQTAGNPFFIRELLAHLTESGERVDTRVTAARLEAPKGLRQVIGHRVARLSAPAGRALSVAAVAGPMFSFVLLERALGERSGVLDALDEAVAAGLLVEAGYGDYVFAHALVRQTIYRQLGSARRMRLHRQLGEALEALGDTEAHVDALAYHFMQAAADGQDVKAATYALAAGARATVRLAYEEAAAHYERGLQALTLTGQPHEERRCELLLALGEARWSIGESDKARDAFKRAADIAHRIGDAAAAADAALGFSGPPFLEVDLASMCSSVVLLERALAILDERDSALRARLMARLAAARACTGDQHDRLGLAHDALAMARRANDKHTLVDVLAACCRATIGPDAPDQRLDIARELTRLAEDVGDVRLRAHVRGRTGLYLLMQGDIDGTLRELGVLEHLADTRKDRYAKWLSIVIRAMLASMKGQLATAESLATEAHGQWTNCTERSQFASTAQLFLAQIIHLRREQGRLDEDGLVERVATHTEQTPAMPAWHCFLAEMRAQLGDHDRAEHDLELLGDLSSLPRNALWLMSVSAAATAAFLLDDLAHSRQAYDLLLPHATTCLVAPSAVCEGSTSRLLGMLATTLGRYDDAELHLQRALEMNAKIRSPLWTAHTQYQYARMLRLRGRSADRDRAHTLLTAATTTANELELHALSKRTSAEARVTETRRIVPSTA